MAPEKEMVNRNDAEGGRSPAPEAFPWDRLPHESAEAYRAFTLYRALDPKIRAYDKVGDRSLIRRWASRFRWATRVAEWEAWLVLNQMELNETARVRHRVDSLHLARTQINKAKRSVEQLNETKMSVEDVIALGESGVRLGRVALDLPPDGPVRAFDASAPGLTVSLPSVPWLAGFIPQTKQNETNVKPNEVVLSGEKVLDETPSIPGRKRLVQSVRDCQPDNVLANESADRESERAQPVQIPPRDKTYVAPPNPKHPYRRCKKHGNACRRGGHN